MDGRVCLRRGLSVIEICAVCVILAACSTTRQPTTTNRLKGIPSQPAGDASTLEVATVQAVSTSTPSRIPMPTVPNRRTPTRAPTAKTRAPTDYTTAATAEPTSVPPCGRHIAFQSTHLGVESIALVDVCSQQVTWLTEGTQQAESPQWSSDGRTIAFLAQSVMQPDEDYQDLWLIDTRTKQASQVTHAAKVAAGSGSFSWSPNGKEILFVGENQDHRGLMIVRVSDGEVRVLPMGLVSPFSWSPDGSKIALAMAEDRYYGATPDDTVISPGRLVIIQPDGQVIAGGQEHGIYPLYSSWGWLWSPDNQRLAVAEWSMARGGGGDIKLVEIEGQDLVTTAHLQDLMPAVIDMIVHSLAWSPTGEEIAFVLVSAEDFGTNPWGQVYIADRAFTRIRTVTPDDMACASVDWAPVGSQLVFACDDGPPKTSLWLVNPDGTELHRITKPEVGTDFPLWQPAPDQ